MGGISRKTYKEIVENDQNYNKFYRKIFQNINF